MAPKVPSPAHRRLPGGRGLQVVARTLHIVSMGLVLGGVAYEAPFEAFALPLALAVGSGLVLFAADLYKTTAYLHQAAGVLVYVKVGLLAAAHWLPELRFELYLAATAVASIGSHMTGNMRHWSVVYRRIV